MNARFLAGCLVALSSFSAVFAQGVTGTALVRHAPNVNGTVDGSVQQMTAESVAFNGGSVVTGDLLVPGTPTLRINGNPNYGGTIDGSGAASPTSYQITLNGSARLSHIVRRTNPVALPVVTAPPAPAGTRTVTITAAGQGAGDFATLRNLTLNGGVGQLAVPAGTYGDFIANGGSGFTLGVPGATEPAVYNFQHLTLNGATQVQVVGPVQINVANGFTANGHFGAVTNPGRLALNIYSGPFTLNGGCDFYGYVTAPNSTVTINGNSQLIGGLACDRLTVNGGGLLRLAAVTTNAPPTVALTSPTAGQGFTAPATISLLASASDSDGTVTLVEFFEGANKIGQAATAPFQFSWSPVAAGSYSLTARATDNSGATATSAAVAIVVNAPPTVALTAPTANQPFTAPANITLQATAADADGLVAKVEFYNGANKIGQALNAPYQFVWTGVAAGSYTLSAIATDDRGATGASSTVTITVNAPPTISITAPGAGATFTAPASVPITVSAADTDGTVAKVDFYNGGSLIGTSSTAPFSFTWTGVGAGGYSLTAVATDNLNATATSAAVSIQVNSPNVPPTIILTSPQNGDVATAPGSFQLVAQASDPDGTVTKVEFFQNATKLGEFSAPPYQLTVNGLAAGPYGFSARATDDAGATATSTTVNVLVNAPPIVALTAPAAGRVFRLGQPIALTANASDPDGTIARVEFYQGTTKLGDSSTAPYQFTWSTAAAGTYALTAKAFDNRNAFTTSTAVSIIVDTPPTVALTGPANNAVFELGTAISLQADANDSDGTVAKVEFYADGTLVGQATSAPYTFSWTTATAGTHTLTARAIDNLDIDTTTPGVAILVNVPPAVALTEPANNAGFNSPANFTLTADATDTDGTIAKVEFFQGTTKLGEATAAPYRYTVSGLAGGSYAFTARATDNLNASSVSTPVNVLVNASPIVVLTTPASGAVFRPGQAIPLAATASDPDGTIARVEFYQGTTKLGESATAPYQFTWTGAAAGTYALTAKAFDSLGAPVTSAVVNITIDTPPTAALTAPANNTVHVFGTPIALAADAADADGTVAKVEFYADGTLIGTDTSAPYAFDWTAATAGAHTLTARVIDDLGVDTISTSIAILVNVPPTVALTAPANNTVFNSPANLALTATAADTDGTIAKVEFFQGTTKLGEATTAPYAFTTNGFLAGTYTLTAKATDNQNASTISAPITVRVSSPPVATAQSVNATPGAVTPITLAATDPDGDALTFAVATNPLHGSLSGSAPNLVYTPAAGFVGFDMFTFTASDAVSTSAAATVTITVSQPLGCVSTQQILPVGGSATFTSLAGTPTLIGWDEYAQVSFPPKKYRKQTSNQFFYHLNSDMRGGCISFPYGSTRIEVTNATSTYSATTGALTTVGVRQYGGRVVSGGSLEDLYSGPLTTSDPYHEADAPKSQVTATQIGFDPPILTSTTAIKMPVADCFVAGGQNHRYLNGNIRWALSEEDTEADARARATTTAGASNTAFRTARTTGFSYSFSEVSYTANFSIPSAGTYYVFYTYAIKPHGQAGPVTSQVIVQPRLFEAGTRTISGSIDVFAKDTDYTLESIIVRPPCSPPSVALTAPANSTSVLPGTSVTFTASALSADGIAKVEFFDGTTKLGEKTAPDVAGGTTYSFTVAAGFSAGSHSFTARATDTLGLVASSPASAVVVNTPPSAQAQTLSAVESTPLSITLVATDADGDALTYQVTANPTKGTLTGTAPNLIYTPGGGTSGADAFTFTANDGRVTSAPATISITIARNPQAPTITTQPTVVIAIPSTRTNPSVVNFTPFELKPSDVGSTSSTNFSTLPTANPALFGLTGTDVRKINFDQFPDGSPVPDGTIISNQYASLGMQLNGIRVGGVYGGAASPPNATFTTAVHRFTFTVPVVAVGIINTSPDQDRIDYYSPEGTLLFATRDHATNPDTDYYVGARVNDGTLIGSVVITNTAGNDEFDELIFEVVTTQVLPGAYAYDVDATDPASSPITYSLTQAPSKMWVNSTSGLIRWIPAAADVGDHPITVRATNAAGYFDTQSFTLRVVLNAKPTVTAGRDITLRAPGSITLDGVATDDGVPAPAVLTRKWVQVSGPGVATFNNDTIDRPLATFPVAGTYVLRFTASDGLEETSDLIEVRVGTATVEPPAGIAAWWPFNAHAHEVVRGGHDFELVEGTTFGAGKVAQGLVFNGSNYARVDPHADLNVGASAAGMSIEFWVRPDLLGPNSALLTWQSPTTTGTALTAEFYGQSPTLRLRYEEGGEDQIDSGTFIGHQGEWFHLVYTYDRPTGILRMYSNGVLVRERQGTPNRTPRTNYTLWLATGALGGFTGVLDELTLYSRPLGSAEVTALYQAGADGKSPPDDNAPPTVNAGPDLIAATAPATLTLAGSVTDDNRPLGLPTAKWIPVTGPVVPQFVDENTAATSATFSAAGTYLLKLTGSDGLLAPVSDFVEVRVGAATASAPSGVAAWWPLNGHVQEVIHGGHEIELVGASLATGKVMQGLAFNGSNYARVDPHADLNVGASAAGLSIEFWVRPDLLGPDSALLTWQGTTTGTAITAEYYGQIPTLRLRYEEGGEDQIDSGVFVGGQGQWFHLVYTYDRPTGMLRMYSNGTLVRQIQGTANRTPRTNYTLWLATGWPGQFTGMLDELTLYSRPLTATEVSAVYQAGADGKMPPPRNLAPTVNAGADRVAFTGTPLSLTGTASDDGLPNPPAALTYAWSKVSGPGGATFSASTALNTNVTLDAPGSYTLRLAVSDSALTTTDDLVVTVTTPASQPPIVAITQPRSGGALPAGVPVQLLATASDPDGTITSVEFFRGTTSLGFAAPVGGQPGTYALNTTFTLAQSPLSLTARATDNTGVAVTSAAVSVTVIADPQDLDATLVTPADDARISAPTIVKGVTKGGILASWALEYRLKAAETATPEPWTTLATGNAPAGTTATPADLATFDPTRLINGIYELRLSATDAAGSTTADSLTVLVEGNMKIGAFTIAFDDLKVPVAGIPITLTRTYDSRDTRVGDFGPGWRLALANIRVQKNRRLGERWHQTEQSGTGAQYYYVTPLTDPFVSVVMPDGETLRFRGGAYVKSSDPSQSMAPDYASYPYPATEGKFRFYPVGDTVGKLEPLNQGNQLFDQFYILGTGPQQLLGSDPRVGDPGELYNVSRFRLTLKDGTVMILDEALGLLEMRDLDGNTLAVNRDAQNRVNGLTATQNAPGGAIARSITVHRDAAGRVDYIRDLANKELDYLYDAQGRLASFTNRELNTTQFRYENAAFPYYLTKIIDPRGIAAIRTEYDPATGRMIKQIDADGNETIFNHGAGLDAATRFEKVKDRLGNETTFFYDDRGNVITKIDPLGAQTTYSYYADTDWAKFETDHYGNVKSFAYDSRGNITVQTIGASTGEDPANPTTGYTTRTIFDERSMPTRMTDPDGRVQTFSYDPATNNLLTHTTGWGGAAPATTTYTYKSDGALDTITDALGNVTSHAYDYAFSDAAYPGAVKKITVTITDPAGAAGSDPANATATVLRTTRTLFDAQENHLAQIITRTLPDGSSEDVVTRYFYDAENRLKATVMPDGRVTEKRYTSFGKEDKVVLWKTLADYTAHVDSNARITSHGYDARGNVISTTYPDGTTERTEFDLENRKKWSQDRRGYRTFFVHDKLGRLRFTIYPDGNDGVGAAAPNAADDARLNDNPRTETQYDLAGRVRFQIDERGAKTEFTYEDGCGCAMRQKEMILHRAAGNLVTHYEYDKAGNVRYVTDPRGNTVETRYDEQGRPRFAVYPATDEHPSTQTETKYDLLDRRVEVVDQEGKATRYRYDALGRLFEVRQYIDAALAASDANFSLVTTTANLAVTRYTYDQIGNQQTQVDALGRVTTYWTDGIGRRTKRILPKDAAEATFLTETLQYDEWGNLWKRTDFAGKTTTFSYDTLNRLKSKTADATHPSLSYEHAIARIEFDYDPNGARSAARTYNAANLLRYTESTPRDERGRIDYKDATGGQLDYSYYANNRLKDVVSSNSGGVNLGYRYDEVNRLEHVDDASTGLPARTTDYTYNANGSLETVATPNGVAHAYGYDTLNRLRTLSVSRGATTLHAYDYKLRVSGHRRQVIENATRTTNYGYDDIYRLTGETIAADANANNGTVSYDLDKVGNRKNRTSSIATIAAQLNRTYNARDWLDGDTYTPNGSTQSGRTALAEPPGIDTFDFEERLIVRTKADSSSINISYDADGHRIQKTVLGAGGASVTTKWLVDTNNLTGYSQVLEERIETSAGTTLKTYTYGTALLSQAVSVNGAAAVLSYYAHDGHGNVRELTDASGAVTDRYDYDASGMLVFRLGATSNAHLYCGEQFDADLGLYYNRARYLNTDAGRFWSMDLFEGDSDDPASLHKYLYAAGNPVDYIDPEGTQTAAEVGTTSGVVGNTARIAIPRAVSAYGRVLGRAACAAARIAQGGAIHHIFTNKNFKAGKKFSKVFNDIFKKAGLDLDGWYNKIQVPGHKGPHADYNEAVLAILLKHIGGVDPSSAKYAAKVVDAIEEVIDGVCNKGGKLYKLLL